MTAEDNARALLANWFGIPAEDIMGVVRHERPTGKKGGLHWEYVFKMRFCRVPASVAQVRLGRARDLLNFNKVRAAFAEGAGMVLSKTLRRDWDKIAQTMLDLEWMTRDTRVEEKALPSKPYEKQLEIFSGPVDVAEAEEQVVIGDEPEAEGSLSY